MTDATTNEQPVQIHKWGHWTPLADGTCHCGQPLKYNLRAGFVGHADPTANEACPEPWPDVPNSAGYEASRQFAATVERAGAALDRALGLPHV